MSFKGTSASGAKNTEYMRIDSSGNVGIGGTPSSSLLHLFDSTVAVKFQSSSTSATPSCYFYEGATVKGGMMFRGSTNGTRPDTVHLGAFSAGVSTVLTYGNGSVGMTIDTSGNVGIGSSTVNVTGIGSNGQCITVNATGTDGALIEMNQSDVVRGYLFANSGNIVLSAVTAIPIKFNTDDTTRMTIDSSGNVGINETAPDGKLHITTSSSDSQLKIERTTTNTGVGWIWANSYFLRFGNESGSSPNSSHLLIGTGGTHDGKIATGGEVSPDVVAGGIHLEVSDTGDAFVIKDGSDEYCAISNLGVASFAGGINSTYTVNFASGVAYSAIYSVLSGALVNDNTTKLCTGMYGTLAVNGINFTTGLVTIYYGTGTSSLDITISATTIYADLKIRF